MPRQLGGKFPPMISGDGRGGSVKWHLFFSMSPGQARPHYTTLSTLGNAKCELGFNMIFMCILFNRNAGIFGRPHRHIGLIIF